MTDQKSRSLAAIYTIATVIGFAIHPVLGFAVITACFVDIATNFTGLR